MKVIPGGIADKNGKKFKFNRDAYVIKQRIMTVNELEKEHRKNPQSNKKGW